MYMNNHNVRYFKSFYLKKLLTILLGNSFLKICFSQINTSNGALPPTSLLWVLLPVFLQTYHNVQVGCIYSGYISGPQSFIMPTFYFSI